MLKDMNVKVESISMSEGMQAMLALAREGPAGNQCDYSAKQREKEEDWERRPHSAASAADRGEGSNPKPDRNRPTSPLQPGVYSSNGDRECRTADGVRGLPNRGRDMCFNQERPRVLTSRGAPTGARRGASRGRPLSSSGGRFESEGWDPAVPRSAPETAREHRPKGVTAATLQQLRGKPERKTMQAQVYKTEPDEHLAEERRAYAAWKRKVIDCARLLDLEANRFRTES